MATRKRGRSGVRTGTKNSGSTLNVASGYSGCCNSFANKINSYKTLVKQTQGRAGKCGRPTTSTLNTFANWINKGAIVQTVTTAQVARWAKSKSKTFSPRTATPNSCKTILCSKFGKSAIKAVARTKTGSFMVVTLPVVSGKKFCFPK